MNPLHIYGAILAASTNGVEFLPMPTRKQKKYPVYRTKPMADPPPKEDRQPRNAPCKCGSGKKHKHCCLREPTDASL